MGEGRRPIGVRVTVFSRPSSCSCATDEPSRTLSDAKRRRGSPLQPRHPSSLIPPPWRPGEPKELRGRLATRRRREQLGEREECGGILDSVGGYSSLGWVWPASLVPRPPRALPSRPQRAHRPQRIDAYPSNGPSQNFFPSPRLRYLPYTAKNLDQLPSSAPLLAPDTEGSTHPSTPISSRPIWPPTGARRRRR